MKTCLVTWRSDSLTYTVAKALAYSGHEVLVWVADAASDRAWDWSLSRQIASIPGASVAEGDAATPPPRLDRLVIQGNPRLLRETATLDRLATVARGVTLISKGDRLQSHGRAWLTQWHEWRWARRWSGKLDRIAYKDGFHPLDLWGLLRSRRVVGFDVHSKFLQDEALFRAIHTPDWEDGAQRPYRANFLGSRDPDRRRRILASVEPYFERAAPAMDPPQGMYWHAYSDAEPAALGPEAFMQVLTGSDFTLCPPGYSLVTHRPVEALLRGSVPVLNADEIDLYDLDLRDGENCIAVEGGRWPEAMQRLLGMDQERVRAMRRNIRALLPERVQYEALARDMCRRLGVED